MLPVNSHPDGRIQRRQKYCSACTQRIGNAWLHQPASAIPRLRSATLDPLLPESPTRTARFAQSRSRTTPSRSGTPPSRSETGPSRNETGTVSQRHPPGVSEWDPLNPSTESPSEPSGITAEILAAVTEAWKLSTREARSLLPGIESALAHEWPPAELTEHLVQNTTGARDPVRVLARRLADLAASRDPCPATPPWCGHCEDTQSRTITVTNPDGTEVVQFCPRCSPQLHRTRPSGRASLQPMERW